MIAILGIRDYLRLGVANAVKICTNAGIKVRMVTGDNMTTAKAIAQDCGIIKSEDLMGENAENVIMEGKEFAKKL